ncbi:MAG: DUF3575 domain-containing protein [Flavobacteriales bacterium]
METEAPPKSFYLKLNPLAIVASQVPGTGEARVGLEMVASPKITTQISAGYLFKSPVFNALLQDTSNFYKNFEFPGYRVQAQLRYYFFKLNRQQELSRIYKPSGLYISGHASYAQASLKPKNSGSVPRIDFSHLNINFIAGVQLLYKDNLGLDVYGGIGYKQNTIAAFDSRGRKEFIDASQFGLLYAYPLKVTLGASLVFGVF